MDWSSVQLRSLVELRRRGTVTAVASALGYTPGAVSQQLGALERSAGVPLLRRVGRRVELTDAGLALAGHAQRILDIEAAATAELEHSAGRIAGELQMALFATAVAEILPAMLARVGETHPDLVVRSRELVVDDVYDAVASGVVDLAVGLEYPDVPIRRDPSLRVVLLYRERFSLAVPAGSLPWDGPVSLARTGPPLGWILPPEDTHYGLAIRTVCRRAGIEPELRHEVVDTAVSLALVEAGIGISTVTDLMLRLRPSRFDVLPLVERFERHIVAVVRASAEHRPNVAAVVEVLRDLARD
ncbi:LysR family transcriptional regulator [Actinoplanes italicus]|uniref:LysR family transcriptional regulator n=1 Tax=Actinoplanes italicus TaxID=113567 RepID=A0A2T0J980_9ACTN|nr:LysR substrate-binding domain-containing protein [Actinoplanes italicus]PRX04032.1 LysR family transcriptional regulator [Actinoplanes italicus]GIE30740.1 LysR family transcriptional regulator [Actinoplanes italicus]